MAKARLLVKRLKAVKNTRKITRTMELVATAKFKKAMDRATEAAAYTAKLSEIVGDLAAGGAEVSHPLLRQPEAGGKAVLLVLTSNRGFCGGYNAAVLRQALLKKREASAEGQPLDIEVSGKRGIAFMNFEGHEVAEEYVQFEDRPAFDEVQELADRYAADFVDGKIARLDVAWMKFESAARQTAVVETLLPLGDLGGDDQSGPTTDYEFVPSAEEILSEIVPAAFNARLFKCFLDAAVSEQIARRVAMKAATENADEMSRDLSMLYNRARQSQITSELAEIIGGAAALE